MTYTPYDIRLLEVLEFMIPQQTGQVAHWECKCYGTGFWTQGIT